MRAWTKSACVVLAWSVLSITLVAVGMTGSVHPAQANTRTASSTEVILTSILGVAATSVTATNPTTSYVVQYGDTLSSIAARFAVRGGWPSLYAANRKAIGPDPDVIHSGTVLVLPGQTAPVRYMVAAGDTLSGIAAEFAVRGGWRALYAANRRDIGADPNVIRVDTVLTIPRPAPGRAFRRQHQPRPRPSGPAGPRHHRLPVRTGPPAATGMPQWLKMMLLAAGVVILAGFLAGPILAVRRRRQQAACRAVQLGKAGGGPRRDRGGRFRGAAAAVRAVAAAARLHPAGVAVPIAVLAAGIVLFTFVKSASVRVVPQQGGAGPGSVHAPKTGQPHYCLQPRRPRPSGEPALPSTRGPNAGSLTRSLEQIYPPLPAPAEVAPAGPGRSPHPSRIPSSSLPGCGLVCEVKQVPSSAVTAGGGGADR